MTKKALTIRHIFNSPHYEVLWEGGGEVPAVLKGSFTTPFFAYQAISAWESANKDEPVEVKEYEHDATPRRGRPPSKPIEG